MVTRHASRSAIAGYGSSMEISTRHTPAYGVARLTLAGREAVRAEGGAMMAMSGGVELSAKAETSGGVLEADIKESGNVGAPLPVIGLRGLWALPYDLWIDAQAQYFALSIDEYDGSLTDLRLMVNWQPKTWLGIGIGYNQFTVDVDVEKNSFDGSLDWTYEGPMLFLSGSF